MTLLQLARPASDNADDALAAAGDATLIRRADGAYVDVASEDVDALIRALAYAGVHATRCEADLAVPPTLLPAVGRDLAPLAGSTAHDVVHVRRLTLGLATRELLRRTFARGPGEAARDRARALLRHDESVIAWSRRAWLTREALRSGAVRRSLRPVVFDRAALDRVELEGRTLATAGRITRWLFA